jgi:hypothetical protein
MCLTCSYARFIAMLIFLLCCSVDWVSAQSIPYERLLSIVQSQDIGSAEFPSTSWRKSTPEAIQSYCKSALTRVPRNTLRVGITEEGASDITEMQIEFAHWQLTTIFLNCIELTQEILDRLDVHQEIRAWIKLARLMEHNKTVLNCIVVAGILPPTHDGNYEDNIFGTGNWGIVREWIVAATLKLLEKDCAICDR